MVAPEPCCFFADEYRVKQMVLDEVTNPFVLIATDCVDPEVDPFVECEKSEAVLMFAAYIREGCASVCFFTALALRMLISVSG